MEDILLSICIPTYNRAEIVYECVQKCLEFQCKNIEIVVNDNCSTDDTKKLLNHIDDPRFYYYCNNRNVGYSNIAIALRRGRGKYCLLLTDEDEIIDIRWEQVLSQLEHDKKTSIFKCKYIDKNGKSLREGPVYVCKKNSYEAFQFIITNFGYAGSVCIKRDSLVKVWRQIDKNTHLWKLYPHIVLALYCAKEGNLNTLENISIRQTKKTNKGGFDVEAWNADMEEPYWSLSSRKKQNEELLNLLSKIDLENDCKHRLMYDICMTNMNEILNYWDMIRSPDIFKTALFEKRPDIILRDRQLKKNEWVKVFLENKKEIDDYAKSLMKNESVSLKILSSYYLSMIKHSLRLVKRVIRRKQ